jgi:homoaconitase/3-isopropylmalate dehydratase large subunit
MARVHAELGSPEIWRNDRFWLAGDHVVHPTIMKHPRIAAIVNVTEKAKNDFKMTEYQGMNYTIMHTEFVRERAEPGMLILGSDSHMCSAGAVGVLVNWSRCRRRHDGFVERRNMVQDPRIHTHQFCWYAGVRHEW